MSEGFRLLVPDLLERAEDYADFDWQPFRQGVQIARFYRDGEDGSSAALLRYAPGASVPAHLHRGFEHILVLEGSQQDERGRYGRGSLLIHGPGTGHRVASPEGCVALAIWVKPIEIL
ncbi:MAG: cupin domain-containing protein [Myxococcales bacterium]